MAEFWDVYAADGTIIAACVIADSTFEAKEQAAIEDGWAGIEEARLYVPSMWKDCYVLKSRVANDLTTEAARS